MNVKTGLMEVNSAVAINIFSNIKLRNKIIAVFCLSVIFPVIAMILIVIHKTTDKIINQTIIISDNLISKLNTELINNFERKIFSIKKVCISDMKLRYILSLKNNYTMADNIEIYSEYLNPYEFYMKSNLIDLKIYFLQKSIIQNYSMYIFANDNIRKKDEFITAISSKNILSWGYNKNGKYIYTAANIYDFDGSISAAAVIYTPFSELRKLIGINDTTSVWKAATIIDNAGNVILTDVPKFEVDGGLLKKITKSPQSQGTIDYSIGGKYKVIYKSLYASKYYPDWKFVIFIPIEQIENDANIIKREAFVFSSVFLIISFMLFFIIITLVTNRIRFLTNQMKEIAYGNFREIRGNFSNDELGIMSKSLNIMIVGLKKLISENYEKNLRIKDIEMKKREAELYALQNQIQPHFLFNTLESIRMKLRNSKADEADSMILNLSKIFRKTLICHSEMITIKEELSLVVSYMEIQRLRFIDEFKYSVNCDEKLQSKKIPKLIIQGLVENSIKHGFENKLETREINIIILCSHDKLYINVKDNGTGIKKDKLKQIMLDLNSERLTDRNEHIGLKNIQDRIHLYYGDEYGLQIESNELHGTNVVMIMPINAEE